MKRTFYFLLLLVTALAIVACDGKSPASRNNVPGNAAEVQAKITFLELGSVTCIPCKKMQPIMKASTVPRAAPFSSKASTTGMIPAAFEYIGIPINTATGTDHQALFPMIEARKFSGT